MIDVEPDVLDRLILEDIAALLGRFRDDGEDREASQLVTASAKRLPLSDKSVDAILTSPPYLTRIDYAVAYSRELAILGLDIAKDRTLRAALMGTTLIRKSSLSVVQYGPLASGIVEQISKHPSKASSGYYLKQARQYLDDLIVSFGEIDRVAKDAARMTLVVQDSYYKDIHIPLAQICIQEAERQGWAYEESESKEVTRLLSQLNSAAQRYAKGKVDETVVLFHRG